MSAPPEVGCPALIQHWPSIRDEVANDDWHRWWLQEKCHNVITRPLCSQVIIFWANLYINIATGVPFPFCIPIHTFTEYILSQSAEIALITYKPWRCVFSIWNHPKWLSWLFMIHLNTYVMDLRPLWLFHFYSVGIDFRRQNLTCTDVRFWRLKSIPHCQSYITHSTAVLHDNLYLWYPYCLTWSIIDICYSCRTKLIGRHNVNTSPSVVICARKHGSSVI